MKIIANGSDSLLLEPVKIEMSAILTGGSKLILPDKQSMTGEIKTYRVIDGELKGKIVLIQPYNVTEGSVYLKRFFTAHKDAIVAFVETEPGEIVIKD